MNKKITIVTVILCLLSALPVFADNPAFRVSSVSGLAGGLVDVHVEAVGNPGISGFVLRLDFDKAYLTPVSVQNGPVTQGGGTITSNVTNRRPGEIDYIQAVWINDKDMAQDGTLFTVQFQIHGGQTGRVPLSLSYEPGDIVNAGLEDVYVNLIDGYVEVEPGQLLATESPVVQTPAVTTPVPAQNPPIGGSSGASNNNSTLPKAFPSAAPNDSGEETAEYAAEPGVSAALPSSAPSFTDITGYPWAADAIYALAQKGIVKGTSASTYSPGLNIKRADYMCLLVRMLKLEGSFSENFADADPNAYYYRELGIAKQAGLAAGIGENRFTPNEPITRQDMFVIAYRALGRHGVIEPEDLAVLEKFEDNADISGYAREAIAVLAGNGLINGDGRAIKPHSYATRAEIAVFINAFQQNKFDFYTYSY